MGYACFQNRANQCVLRAVCLCCSWLGIVLILGFMFVVIVVLLNILIAQLSDTYQNVQSDAQREVELNRAYIVGHIEKNSLMFKVCGLSYGSLLFGMVKSHNVIVLPPSFSEGSELHCCTFCCRYL